MHTPQKGKGLVVQGKSTSCQGRLIQVLKLVLLMHR